MLRDCDSLFPKHEPLYGNTITRDLTHGLNQGFWMAEGVYRFWRREGSPVVGVTVILCSAAHPNSPSEPILVVGRMWFSREPRVADSWLLWQAQRNWEEDRPLGRIMEYPNHEEGVENVKAIAVPLYHIEKLEDIKKLFMTLGEEFENLS